MKTLLSSKDPSLLHKQLPKRGTDFIQMYYNHGLGEDKDGYYAAYADAWYWSDIQDLDQEQLSIVWQYMGNPTYGTAAKLLKAQNIQVPFKALLDHLKSTHSTASAPKATRGGMEDLPFTVPVSKKRRVIKSSTVKMDTMIGLDTLKDIHPYSPKELWDMVHMKEDVKKRLCTITDEATFRQESAKSLAEYLGLSNQGKSDTIAITSDPVSVKIEKDTLLWRQMTKWMTNASDENELMFVLDGLIDEVNQSGFLMTIMLHALFHAMIVNMPKVHTYVSTRLGRTSGVWVDALPYQVDKVTLLNGNFQNNDGMQLSPFFQKMIQAISKEVPKLKEVRIVYVPDHASYFEKYYDTDPSGLHWSKKGHVMRKQELEAKMKIVKKKKQSNKIKDMAVRNFVRDAWKADIAIKYNAVFFTCDQNALMYHKWICGQEIVDRHAVALFLGADAFVRV